MNLNKIATAPADYIKKEDIESITEELLEKIRLYQNMMYAQNKHSMLIILQGMDASGKDGAVKDIFSGINPLGCRVFAWKAPTEEEFAHDFLRRIHKCTPEKGMIHIFNRSYYEDILVPTVSKSLPDKMINKRYDHINNFEQLLVDNDTHILKFYLHVSEEEQKRKLEERLKNPEKFRKHNDNDRISRKKRDEYRDVYHHIFKKCNQVPWHIIPADKNWWKIYQIAQIIVQHFEEMDLKRPALETKKFN